MNIDDFKNPFLKYRKITRKIIIFVGIIFFSFILGWITCVCQVYNYFLDYGDKHRELYDDNFQITVFPLEISVQYHYFPSEENNDPQFYASTVDIEYNNSLIPLSYSSLFEEKEYITAPYFMHEYIYSRRNFIKEQIKKMQHNNLSPTK